jgi:DNA-binding NtrC family response regulator
MATGRLLVVEDRDSLRRMLQRALSDEGYQVETAADGSQALGLLRGARFDLVLTDLKLPDASGLDILAASRQNQPSAPVVVLTGYGSVGSAVEAMKLGAYDFLEKPVELDDLTRLIAQAIGHVEEDAVFSAPGTPPIIGRHPRLRAALRLLSRVAKTESTVLLTGESGTGKELFARALHGLSARHAGPLVTLNCAAIPETLIENELFGHERGAFTGADRREPGRFELAQGGTLFLDEIGELPLAVQGKVLRVLEERTFERVGSGRTHEADVRLVAATNRPLRAMVDAGSFRADLYFRLEIFPIALPPLRERASDIPLLAAHLLQEISRRHDLGAKRLEEGAAELLSEQSWEGNVRELANLLERAAILGDGSVLRASDIRQLLGSDPKASSAERERLRLALTEAGGDKKEAAKLAGMPYRTLLRKVREHDLEGVPKYRQ